jgi:hypothetical protein
MELLSVIRRWRIGTGFSIREISRRTGLSRNTVRKYLRTDGVEPRSTSRTAQASSIPMPTSCRTAPGGGGQVPQAEADDPAVARRSGRLGYEGSYNRVSRRSRASGRPTGSGSSRPAGRGAFVPLAFQPGEAFQFDWSEDWAIIGGERTKLQVAHFKLSLQPRLHAAGLSASDP